MTEFIKTLYIKNSKGKIRIWEIEKLKGIVNGYVTRAGELNGKLTSKITHIRKGNSNRTIDQQIDLEVASKIKVKVSACFVSDINEARVAESKQNESGFFLPMLAVPKPPAMFDSSALVQRKYDGLRFLVTNQKGTLRAYSKTGMGYPYIPHIMDSMVIPEGYTIDGEAYAHGVSLQKINSWVKRPQVNTEKIRYQAYDLISNKKFSERIAELRDVELGDNTTVVETWGIRRGSIKEMVDESIAQGYEGIIVRQDVNGYQIGKRNSSMVKFKRMHTAEATIISISATKDGFARLHCKLPNGIEFKVLGPGTHAEKKEMLYNSHKYILSLVEFKYASISDGGSPTQPTALFIRSWQ